MSVETIDAAVLWRLYAIFRLHKRDDYLTSVKLVFIYEQLLTTTGATDAREVFEQLSQRRRALRRNSNLRTLDAVYTECFMDLLRQRGIFAAPETHTPYTPDYMPSGWRP